MSNESKLLSLGAALSLGVGDGGWREAFRWLPAVTAGICMAVLVVLLVEVGGHVIRALAIVGGLVVGAFAVEWVDRSVTWPVTSVLSNEPKPKP